MPIAKRLKENPLISPNLNNKNSNDSVFNACPIIDKDKIHLLYRAISDPQKINNNTLKLSSIFYAKGNNFVNFKNHRQIIKPEKKWEIYGCEDPRITKINQKYYIFYTALSKYPFCAEGIRIGLTITSDFKKFKKYPVTHFNSKAMTLFPQKIGGKYVAILSVNTDSPPANNCLAYFDKLEDIYSEAYWRKWYYSLSEHIITLEKGTKNLVEIGAPPIKTKHGWLLIYAHIRNYHSHENSIYGIEAALLDLKNPKKVIGQTDDPLLIPSENYELYGKVPNVIFPSGAILKNNDLYIYYGAADTHVCAAKISFTELVNDLISQEKKIYKFQRFKNNPILEPTNRNNWEAKAVFNPTAIKLNNEVHIIYRAMSKNDISVLAYARSRNTLNIDERLPYPIYIPREKFEKGPNPNSASGCEDPRIVKIDNRLYLTYTAFNGKEPRVALSSISQNDFLKKNWQWEKPILISAPNVENKNCVIFSEKINNKYVFLHRPDNKNIWIDYFSDLNFKNKFLDGKILLHAREDKWDSLKIGAAASPIKTKKGWLLIYHGLSKTSRHYRVGAVLLDLKNPEKILGRSSYPLMSPQMPYELEGQINNVVFPCGVILDNNKIIIYYGGADSVIGVAYMNLTKLLKSLL